MTVKITIPGEGVRSYAATDVRLADHTLHITRPGGRTFTVLCPPGTVVRFAD